MEIKGVNGQLVGELTLILGVAAAVFVLSSALLATGGGGENGAEEEEEEKKKRGGTQRDLAILELAVQSTPLDVETEAEAEVQAPLPREWLELQTDEGQTYYYNEESQVGTRDDECGKGEKDTN